jgi:hypothetical protein
MLSELEQLVDIPVFYVIRASRMVDICHEKVLALEDLRHWDDNTKRSCSVHGDLGQLVADDDKTEGAIFDNVADYVCTPSVLKKLTGFLKEASEDRELTDVADYVSTPLQDSPRKRQKIAS